MTLSIEDQAAVQALINSIEPGRPWVVQDRHSVETAVAVKKSGGRDDEIIWDYTFSDGHGDYCAPEEFADRFVPIAPMAAVAGNAWTDAAPAGTGRASEWQIALWTALAGPVTVHAPSSLVQQMQDILDQSDDRAAEFPAVLAALVAERAHATHTTPHQPQGKR